MMSANQPSPVMVWRAASDGALIEANAAWLHFTGRTVEQTLGLGWHEDVHPEDLPHLLEVYRTASARQAAFCVEIRLRHFTKIFCRVLLTGLPQPQGEYLGSAVELAAQPTVQTAAQALQAPPLQERDDQFFYALEAMQGLLYDWDRRTDTIYRSGAMRQIIGYDPDEVPTDGLWWNARIHPEDRRAIEQHFVQIVAAQAPTLANEYRIQHKDGHYMWVRDFCRIFYDAEADCTGAACRTGRHLPERYDWPVHSGSGSALCADQ